MRQKGITDPNTGAPALTLLSYSQDSLKEDHIRQFMEITGSAKMGKMVMDKMIESYKKIYPAAASDFWDEFAKEINLKDLVDMIVPIYGKYFSDEEITQLIAFYKTPLGKKIIETMPLIMQDSYGVGQAWGTKLAEKIQLRLKEKGYIQHN